MFVLHPTLAGDTFFLGDWPLCRVLLMNQALLPWLILVPRWPDLREWHDLPAAHQGGVMEEISRASRVLAAYDQVDKVNVGALGNLVPQLHIHVVARTRQDPAWPGPVWGRLPATPYGEEQRQRVTAAWQARLALSGPG